MHTADQTCAVKLLLQDRFSYTSDGDDSTRLSALGWDSLSLLDFALGLEDELNCIVQPEQLSKCETVGELLRVVQRAYIEQSGVVKEAKGGDK